MSLWCNVMYSELMNTVVNELNQDVIEIQCPGVYFKSYLQAAGLPPLPHISIQSQRWKGPKATPSSASSHPTSSEWQTSPSARTFSDWHSERTGEMTSWLFSEYERHWENTLYRVKHKNTKLQHHSTVLKVSSSSGLLQWKIWIQHWSWQEIIMTEYLETDCKPRPC